MQFYPEGQQKVLSNVQGRVPMLLCLGRSRCCKQKEQLKLTSNSNQKEVLAQNWRRESRAKINIEQCSSVDN